MNEALKAWYEATENLANEFVITYFTDEEDDAPETWWVADDIGGVFFVNDY